MKKTLRRLSEGQCVAARSEADRQRDRLFITLSIAKNRRNVFQVGRCNNFLYHRFTFRILPHRPYTRVQSQVSIHHANGKVAVQMYTIWTQSGPSLLPIVNRQGADGLQQFCDGVPG